VREREREKEKKRKKDQHEEQVTKYLQLSLSHSIQKNFFLKIKVICGKTTDTPSDENLSQEQQDHSLLLRRTAGAEIR
jgi:hypothetical protein